jgi:phage terminase large subunit-like protein
MLSTAEQLITAPADAPSPTSHQVAQLSSRDIERLRSACLRSEFFLTRGVLGYKDLDPLIHKPICDMLQNYLTITRRLIVLPRTWFKSTVASVGHSIWRMLDNPEVRLLIAQNSFSNAQKKVGSVKSTWEKNELLRALFPELLPDGTRPWSADCLTINRKSSEPEGTLEPAGTGTGVTSRHYDEVTQDDTVAPDYDASTGEIQQPTSAEIEKAVGFHKMCHPLLLHPTRSAITVVGTRWAVNDLIGWIIKNTPEYAMVSRSALENANGDPATVEQGGKAIWSRFDEHVLSEIRRTIGTLMFDMLYMNTPSSSVNQVFKREMVRYYEQLPNSLLFCTSVDPAPSELAKTTDTDYNVVLTTALRPSTGEVWVVHYDMLRCDPGKLIDILFDHYVAYHPVCVRIEATAYQATLCYWIRQRQAAENRLFRIDEVKRTRQSKSAHIMSLEPWFSAGRVYMHHFHSDLERQLIGFDPQRQALAHDDVIDALAMQVEFWSRCCEVATEERREEAGESEFSGKAVVDELLGRAKLAHQYPYDIGLMGERLGGILPRHDYVRTYEGDN